MGKPKHIFGAVAVEGERHSLAVQFLCADEEGYDRIINVEDLDPLDLAEVPNKIFRKNEIVITYVNSRSSGSKRFRMYFASGDVEDITVLLPPVNRGFESVEGLWVNSQEVSGLGGGHKIRYELIDVLNGGKSRSQNAVIPHSDPENVFSYDKIWRSGGGNTIFKHDSNNLDLIWGRNGYYGGAPSEKTASLQHATFIGILDETVEYTSPAELFMASQAKVGPQTYMVFVWAKDLKGYSATSEQVSIFEVCTDQSSPSYFRTTGTETDGTVIPANYLNGVTPAVWQSTPCPIDCREFATSVTVVKNDGVNSSLLFKVHSSPDSPIEKPSDKTPEGAYKRPTYAALNTLPFSLQILLPAGMSYSGKTVFPAVIGTTSWTITDLPYSTRPYTAKFTDGTDHCVDLLPFMHYDPADVAFEGRNCECYIPGALNYQAPPGGFAEELDGCGICLTCKQGYLSRDGVQLGENLVLNTNSVITNVSVVGGSDGQIAFNGVLNPNVPTYMLTGLYHINLYQVSGPTADPVDINNPMFQGSSLTSPNYLFSGLPEGDYVIHAYSTGQICVSSYRFKLSAETEAERFQCLPQIQYNINPCSGQVTVQVTQPGIQNEVTSVVHSVNGMLVSTPFNVVLGDVIGTYVNFTSVNCTDSYSEYIVQQSDLFCPTTDPGFDIYGCMDSAAFNFNPMATISDGSCFYGTPGCMDPTAANFDPAATVNNGSCLYGLPGCMDPNATNYDPNATIDNGSCYDACSGLIFAYGEYSIPNGNISITFVDEPETYTVVWIGQISGDTHTVQNSGTSPSVGDDVWIFTVTDANGCQQTGIVGVNTSVVFGCLDANASNFSPQANVSIDLYDFNLHNHHLVASGPCIYKLDPSVCIPTEQPIVDATLLKCISDLSTSYLTRLKAGMLKDCNDKEFRIVHLIQYLLSQKGLDCIYNCADSQSPNYIDTPQGMPCETRWDNGGPSGTQLIYSNSVTYSWGDVVRHPTSGRFYTYIGSLPSTGVDPEAVSSNQTVREPWSYCVEPFPITDTTNRLDAYLAFVRKACKDCGLPGAPRPPERPIEIEPNEVTLDGEDIEINGNQPRF